MTLEDGTTIACIHCRMLMCDYAEQEKNCVLTGKSIDPCLDRQTHYFDFIEEPWVESRNTIQPHMTLQ